MFVFAIVFTQTVTDHIVDTGSVDEELSYFWGSLTSSMFTLFKSISGGVSWQDASEPLQWVYQPLQWLFAGYIAFTYFAVLNVVTGVFCNSAIETASRDPDL